MDDTESALRGLASRSWKRRRRSLDALRGPAAQGTLDPNALAQALPRLTRMWADPDLPLPHELLQLLVLAADGGMDLSAAVPTLEKLARMPRWPVFREGARKALWAYYEKVKGVRRPVAREGLALPENWSLEDVIPRAIYLNPLAGTGPRAESELPCAVCGSPRTVTAYEDDESASSGISGMVQVWSEVECLDCGSYSLYACFDQWFPAD